MNELIKVTTNENGDQLVSARELHRSLEIKTRFSLWVTQNFKPFRDGVDFTSAVSTTVVNNGAVRELQEYALSVEMAKHIAMVTGTSKGFEVRDYFISVEKAWNNPDMVVQRAMQIQQRKIDSLQIENAEMKPKALFADAVATSHTSILVGELAKIIKQNGVEIGANRLFHWLRANGFLIKRKGTDWNMPTQKSMELGLFEVKETAINRSDGSVSVSKTAKVTGKGQQYFINKFLNHELQLA
ncbi:phage antirepressor KilAC domain-containing protein [Carnobacterium maltaromaticum]|uniref:phage antirepressor KilAC domain-containing protein n=1 Tax=Carnobacterium maltaromaticum TaxID=2751 RepID=UPI00026C8623|nr:phage antirepressor KilAC domain-containing protein [Carnobacterium maltaromaticum]